MPSTGSRRQNINETDSISKVLVAIHQNCQSRKIAGRVWPMRGLATESNTRPAGAKSSRAARWFSAVLRQALVFALLVGGGESVHEAFSHSRAHQLVVAAQTPASHAPANEAPRPSRSDGECHFCVSVGSGFANTTSSPHLGRDVSLFAGRFAHVVAAPINHDEARTHSPRAPPAFLFS